MLPLKPEYFAWSHPCLNGENDDRPDVGVLVLLVCFFQSFELAAFRRRFRAGDEGGILTLSTGFDDSINPRSFIAILRQCRIKMRS